MLKEASVSVRDHIFFVQGELDFYNVMDVLDQGLQYIIQESQNARFDFSGLKTCDSSGLALILVWTKQAKKYHKTIAVFGLSHNLWLIAKVAGIAGLIKPSLD